MSISAPRAVRIVTKQGRKVIIAAARSASASRPPWLKRILRDRPLAFNLRTGNADSNDAPPGIGTQLGFEPRRPSLDDSPDTCHPAVLYQREET